MAMGPGKYDDLCTYVREEARAKGAIVIVLDGKDGPGFACQSDLPTLLEIPSILRFLADQIEEDMRNKG